MDDTNNVPKLPEMRLELVPVPVSDVDRAKAFYEKVGFGLGVDVQFDTFRVVQFTPPGSSCSIVFGEGMGDGVSGMVPGSVKGLHLVVKDIEEARNAMLARGIEVGPIEDVGGVKYVYFGDPDGNVWALQEFPPERRQPHQSFYGE